MAHDTITRFAALALLVAPACIYVEDDDWHDPYIEEVEPNDVHWTAQQLGTVGVGETILVRGHVTDTGFDRFDGFAFRSEQPMDIHFELYADDPHVDLDLSLFDPYTHTTVASWETTANPEVGEFTVWSTAFEFHLVVSSFHGSGAYVLEVRGTPIGWYGDGAGALAAPATPGALGALGATDRTLRAIDWTGYADGGTAGTEPERDGGVELTTLLIDPATGRVEARTTRRLPAAALRARED
jgi:hypothetical protein